MVQLTLNKFIQKSVTDLRSWPQKLSILCIHAVLAIILNGSFSDNSASLTVL